jgi:DNA-directed RNA polymerase III subunit RPC2
MLMTWHADDVARLVTWQVRSNGFERTKISKAERARDILANVILTHVPVVDFDCTGKVIYVSQMLRRMIVAQEDPSALDDMDYYGNKRLELSGQLLSLLFEDNFKKLCSEMRRTIEHNLRRKNADVYDAVKVPDYDRSSPSLAPPLPCAHHPWSPI